MKMLSPALKRIVIASTPEAISQVRVCILDEASALGFAESDLLDLALGLEEALANALEHGNGRDRSKRIFVHYRVTPDQAVVEIEDEGNGFDPQSVADPTLNDNLHRIRGRGIFLMRALLDGVSYRAGGSLVRIVKRHTSLTATPRDALDSWHLRRQTPPAASAERCSETAPNPQLDE